MYSRFLISFIMTAAMGSANAADNAKFQRGGMCFTNHVRISGADVLWNCEHLGKVTIRQIYENGFRVAAINTTDPAEERVQFQYLVIEEQRR